jgi:phage protein D/phage baseplate assembly protein gpV
MPSSDAVPVPGCKVLLNGAEIDVDARYLLLDVTVRDSLLLPDTAVVRFQDPEGKVVNNAQWAVSADLEIKFAETKDEVSDQAFAGEIVAIEPVYSERGLIVSFRAYDKGWRLNRARKSTTFTDVTAADIVRKIAGEEGLGVDKIDEEDLPKFEHLQQSMETNWEICWRLARMHNREFFVKGAKCNFVKREPTGPAETLVWNADNAQVPLLSFKPRLSGVGQVKSVEVRNNDPATRDVIVGKAAEAKLAHSSEAVSSRSSTIGKLVARDVVVADRIAADMNEATALAQVLLDRLASSFVEAEGKIYGNPKVRAGATVKLEGVHKFSGEYVLSETTHKFGGGEAPFTTSFVISGRTSHRFRDLLKSTDNPDWGSSLVIGIVTNNIEKQNDTETNGGRVKVKYPGLGDAIESGWARVATPHAGKDRGMFFLPQVDDEVVVAFEHGDTRRPIVIGSLYNGRDKPPADLLATTQGSGGKHPRFGVKTPHEVFVEGTQQRTLRSHEKMTVEVKKDGQNGTGDYLLDATGKIETKAGTSAKHTTATTFEVDAGSSVTIKGKGSVTVEATAGLTLKGATVDIQASGPVNVKGATINLG